MKISKLFVKIINQLLVVVLFFSFSGVGALAFDSSAKINVYSNSDTELRNQIDVASVRNTNYVNFYIDQYTWSKLSLSDQYKLSNFTTFMASEFEYNMYPKIIKLFPGVKNWLNYQDKIIVVLTPMTNGIQGYIRWDDFNTASQSQTSNQGNIIYLNSNNILNPSISNNVLYAFFAHEFMHLITYHEKNLGYNTEEATWLEELRGEYLSHYLGYNQTKDSYLNFRLQNGVSLTDVNLANWNNNNNSYSLINLFGIYLAQRFGSAIIFNTLTNNLSGIEAVNRFLSQNGFSDRFSNVYQDWIIANILNDCSIGPNYCYKDIDIQITIPGTSFFLPVNNDSVLSISDSLTSYQTKYQKIVGGSDNLEIILENTKNNIFQKIPYILVAKDGTKNLNFFEFQNETIKQIKISNYSKQYQNVIIIPMFANGSLDATQLFKWHINSTKNSTNANIVKPIVKTTTTTNENSNPNTNDQPTTTTIPNGLANNDPDFGNASPIIVNVINPVKIIPWYAQLLSSFRVFFRGLFSKFF